MMILSASCIALALLTSTSTSLVLTQPHNAAAIKERTAASSDNADATVDIAAAPLDTRAEVTKSGSKYVLAGVGTFNHQSTFTFSNSMPAGLQANTYVVAAADSTDGGAAAPYDHQYTTDNAYVANGLLNLRVRGGQRKSPIKCAEVQTTINDIQYASVRTFARLPTVPGTCSGMFFYQSDNQEIDIEWLSDPNSLSNDGRKKPIPMQYTNQAITDGEEATYAKGPAPSNVTTTHEYRIDWVQGRTSFFLDGALQKTFTDNVPTTPGPWIWNHWTNGDQGWSAGPPQADAIFQIEKIVMYYNQSSS